MSVKVSRFETVVFLEVYTSKVARPIMLKWLYLFRDLLDTNLTQVGDGMYLHDATCYLTHLVFRETGRLCSTLAYTVGVNSVLRVCAQLQAFSTMSG